MTNPLVRRRAGRGIQSGALPSDGGAQAVRPACAPFMCFLWKNIPLANCTCIVYNKAVEGNGPSKDPVKWQKCPRAVKGKEPPHSGGEHLLAALFFCPFASNSLEEMQ